MSQTLSITEARDKFPSLVRQVAEQDDPVIVTSRNRPRVVLVRWETYQHQQQLQREGAAHRLRTLVEQMQGVIAPLIEGYEPDSYQLTQGRQELLVMAQDAWATSRSMATSYRHLASLFADGLLNSAEANIPLTLAQLNQLHQLLPLLIKPNLNNQDVAAADRQLVEIELDAMAPVDDALASLYEHAGL